MGLFSLWNQRIQIKYSEKFGYVRNEASCVVNKLTGLFLEIVVALEYNFNSN